MVTAAWIIGALLCLIIILRSATFFAWHRSLIQQKTRKLAQDYSLDAEIPRATGEFSSTGIVPGGVSYTPGRKGKR